MTLTFARTFKLSSLHGEVAGLDEIFKADGAETVMMSTIKCCRWSPLPDDQRACTVLVVHARAEVSPLGVMAGLQRSSPDLPRDSW